VVNGPPCRGELSFHAPRRSPDLTHSQHAARSRVRAGRLDYKGLWACLTPGLFVRRVILGLLAAGGEAALTEQGRAADHSPVTRDVVEAGASAPLGATFHRVEPSAALPWASRENPQLARFFAAPPVNSSEFAHVLSALFRAPVPSAVIARGRRGVDRRAWGLRVTSPRAMGSCFSLGVRR